jgi:NADP-dependent 3-hydroxy acid dehydrogenase YdfG
MAVSETVGAMTIRVTCSPSIAHSIAFAIEPSADVDVGEIVIRPTAQA